MLSSTSTWRDRFGSWSADGRLQPRPSRLRLDLVKRLWGVGEVRLVEGTQ